MSNKPADDQAQTSVAQTATDSLWAFAEAAESADGAAGDQAEMWADKYPDALDMIRPFVEVVRSGRGIRDLAVAIVKNTPDAPRGTLAQVLAALTYSIYMSDGVRARVMGAVALRALCAYIPSLTGATLASIADAISGEGCIECGDSLVLDAAAIETGCSRILCAPCAAKNLVKLDVAATRSGLAKFVPMAVAQSRFPTILAGSPPTACTLNRFVLATAEALASGNPIDVVARPFPASLDALCPPPFEATTTALYRALPRASEWQTRVALRELFDVGCSRITAVVQSLVDQLTADGEVHKSSRSKTAARTPEQMRETLHTIAARWTSARGQLTALKPSTYGFFKLVKLLPRVADVTEASTKFTKFMCGEDVPMAGELPVAVDDLMHKLAAVDDKMAELAAQDSTGVKRTALEAGLECLYGATKPKTAKREDTPPAPPPAPTPVAQEPPPAPAPRKPRREKRAPAADDQKADTVRASSPPTTTSPPSEPTSRKPTCTVAI